MEAPEKIYIHPDIGGREFLRPWLHRPANNESVEYTRTDVFIKKACEWLFSHILLQVDYYEEDIHTNADRSEFIKKFRKAMTYEER